jgi:IMP dehydrogenase
MPRSNVTPRREVGAVAEIEIGAGKLASRGYGLDEVAIVPSRRTRDPEEVDLSWELDAYRFDLPIVAAPLDAVTSPATAVSLGRLGVLGVLDTEGLWGRLDDPLPALAELALLPAESLAGRLRWYYEQPVRPGLVAERVREIKAAGAVAAVAVTPQRTAALLPALTSAEVDLVVIRGTVVSAEHVARGREPLNLKRVIRELEAPVLVGGCASYQAALHLMRTGAVGVLVGVGAGSTARTAEVLGVGVPQATAIADVAAARMRHLVETGVYCHVLADGGVRSAGELARAIACGADAVVVGSLLAASSDAPGRGRCYGSATAHARLPKASPVVVEPGVRTPDSTGLGGAGASSLPTMAEVLLGPAHRADGRTNLAGGLRAAMAACGYESVREFQKADLVVAGARAGRSGG